jgi:dienelactone hydrolase
MRHAHHALAASSLVLLLACGDDGDGVFGGGSPSSSSGETTSSSSGTGGAGGAASTTSGTTTSSTTTGAGGEGGGTVVTVDDPAEVGPYTTTSFTEEITVAATGNEFDVIVYHPTGGPSSGPYPVVIFGHGFQLTPSRYLQYGAHLASHGYVVLLPDFPTEVSFLPGGDNFTHLEAADDLIGSLDWALADATLGAIADETRVGTTGHSLGGKLAFLVATRDPEQRVKAVIGIDPVDGSPGNTGCSTTECPDVSSAMPAIPTAVLGETLNGSGALACAPTAENYVTFYNGASSPAIEVTVIGADHVSFLDNEQSCLACLACTGGTATNADVTALSRAYVTAFFQRRLRNIAGYDTYLTGAEAQARYVTTNQATIRSK